MRRSAGLFGSLLFLAGSMALGAEKPATLNIGDPAPRFSLPGVDGKTYALKSFAQAKILMVVFTCNHCPTAQAYEERLKKLVTDYRDKGVAVVAISPNDPKAVRLDELGYTDLSDSFDEMKTRAKHMQFNFPYLYDGDKQEVSRAYGPNATPHVFIFDSDRKLRFTGRIDDSERENLAKSFDTRNALDALLSGKPVPVEKTRTFGCSIKWADKRESVEDAMKKLAAESVSVESLTPEVLAALQKKESDKLRLINVWGTWCGPCLAEFPDLVTTNRMYRHRGFELITISINQADEQKEVLALLKKHQVSNKNYILGSISKDKLAEALDKNWSGVVPYTVLIRPDGEVVYKLIEEPVNALELRRIVVKNLGSR
jgi:peroxiredoxin